MKCKKCGAEVPDEMTFCTVCGEPMEPPEKEKPEKGKASKKKKILIIGGTVLGVMIVVLLLILIFSGNGAEKRVTELYKAALEYDVNAVLEVLPPAVHNHAREQLNIQDSSLEIIDSRKLKPTRIAELDGLYAKTYGTEAGYIEDAVLVEVELTYHGEALSRDPVSLYMVKIDGNWYLDIIWTAEELEEAEWQDVTLPDLLPDAA